MENTTCGLTRAELDAHQVGISQLCPALKPDGTQCNCPYSAHLSAPAPAPGGKRKIEDELQPGIFNRILNFFWTSIYSNSPSYFRVTGRIIDSIASKGYRSTVYKCAQDHMAYYCENGFKKSIFYEINSKDMEINLLFERKDQACGFQNALLNFRFTHPTFGNQIHIDEDIKEVHFSDAFRRVLHNHYDGADNNESPALSLADIKHVLSSNTASVSYDPMKALQSLEDITILPGLKYYWCHLVSRKVRNSQYNENNCIWGSWIFHQYFDALNTQNIGVPLIAVKYMNTAEQTEDIPVGDRTVTRKRVVVHVEFIDSQVGRNTALLFQSFMKNGTRILDALHYESFLHPKDPEQMQQFLNAKYDETMEAWVDEN